MKGAVQHKHSKLCLQCLRFVLVHVFISVPQTKMILLSKGLIIILPTILKLGKKKQNKKTKHCKIQTKWKPTPTLRTRTGSDQDAQQDALIQNLTLNLPFLVNLMVVELLKQTKEKLNVQ